MLNRVETLDISFLHKNMRRNKKKKHGQNAGIHVDRFDVMSKPGGEKNLILGEQVEMQCKRRHSYWHMTTSVQFFFKL